MKKIILLLFIVLFSSCLGTKKVIKTTKKEVTEESLMSRIDSLFKLKEKEFKSVKKSKPIKKVNSISLKTADSIANKKINEALRNFRYTEKSGKNTLNAFYDEKTIQLILKAYIEGSKSVKTESSKETESSLNKETESSSNKETEWSEEIYKRITTLPWWSYIAIYFLFLDRKITYILGEFIPFLSGKNSILSIISLFFKKTKENTK